MHNITTLTMPYYTIYTSKTIVNKRILTLSRHLKYHSIRLKTGCKHHIKTDKIIQYSHQKPHVKQIKIPHISIINQTNFPILYRNISPIPMHKNNAISYKFLHKTHHKQCINIQYSCIK